MLHMVVATHGPETCGLAVPQVRHKLIETATRLEQVAKDYGCTLEGAWTGRSNHTMYLLMDGRSAHDVEDVLVELRMVEWDTAAISPVFTLEDGIATLERL